jgi:hypothetical protein
MLNEGDTNMGTKHFKMLLIIIALGLASPAFAKKSRRAGLNFGTGFKILSANDRVLPSENYDKTKRITSSSQAFSPYVGISNGILNIGIRGTFSTKNNKEVETQSGTAIENTRDYTINTKSVSFFTKFLFGKILFLEAGAGIYSQEQFIKNTMTNGANPGNFIGEKEEYIIKGSGPGYHAGIGFEIATGAGFYFNGSYLSKIYQINEGESIFGNGRQKAYEQKRELMFGLSHYYN